MTAAVAQYCYSGAAGAAGLQPLLLPNAAAAAATSAAAAAKLRIDAPLPFPVELPA